MRRELNRFAAALGACLVGLVVSTASAQQSTTTAETKKFQVISVDGNQLVLRGADGATKEFTVPEGFKFDVNGQQLSVSELKPGMKGTATITTTTTVTPVTVTEVRNATVMQTSGNSLIVRGQNGIRMFSEADVAKHNMKIMRNGEPANLSDFHSGDKISATIITEMPPETLTERQVKAKITQMGGGAAMASGGSSAGTGSSGAASSAAPSSGSMGGASSGSAHSGSAGRKLPKTASQLPLMGLAGGIALAIGLGMTLARRRAA